MTGTYRFEGKLALHIVLLCGAACALICAGGVLAWSHLRAIADTPSLQLVAVWPAPLLGLASGGLVAVVVGVARTRDRLGGALMILAGGACGWLVGWALRLTPDVALSPAAIAARAEQLFHVGVTLPDTGILPAALRGAHIQGLELLAIWAAETLLLALGLAACATRPFRRPVCPFCSTRCAPARRIARVPFAGSARQAVRNIADHRWSYFAPSAATASRFRRLDFWLSSCAGCQHTNALTVEHVRGLRSRVLIKHLLLGSDTLRTVRKLGVTAPSPRFEPVTPPAPMR